MWLTLYVCIGILSLCLSSFSLSMSVRLSGCLLIFLFISVSERVFACLLSVYVCFLLTLCVCMRFLCWSMCLSSFVCV